MMRKAAARRPISIPLLASENEQPHAAKVITVSVVKTRSSRRRVQVRASSAVDAEMHSAARTWDTRIEAPYEGRASAARALIRNHETDENPSTVSECGVSATVPWRANVLEKARVIAPSSQPLSPISKQTAMRAVN